MEICQNSLGIVKSLRMKVITMTERMIENRIKKYPPGRRSYMCKEKTLDTMPSL